jgi:hypothetical protein
MITITYCFTTAAGWRYLAPAAIASVDPSTGRLGTRVSISGSGCSAVGSSAARVSLAGVNVSSIASSNSTLVVVLASDATPRVGNVEIEADMGATVVLVDGWT